MLEGNSISILISVVIALAGSGGIVFGALRYNRDEAGRIVIQQTNVLTDMRGLNDELSEALDRMRTEKSELHTDLQKAREEMQALRQQNAALAREHVQMRIERDEYLGEVRACRLEIVGLRAQMRKAT